MKYELTGLALTLQAESVRDAIGIAESFGLLKFRTLGVLANEHPPEEALSCYTSQLDRQAEVLDGIKNGNLRHVVEAQPKRPWFAVEAHLGPEYVAPYADALKRMVGYAGDIPELVFQDSVWWGLRPTHIRAHCTFSSAGVHSTGFIQAEDWNGQPAASRARLNFVDYEQEAFGFRPFEREFKHAGGGAWVPNPDYGRKHHAAQPGFCNAEIWGCLVAWWRREHANRAQRQLMDAAEATARASRIDAPWALSTGGREQGSLASSSGLYFAGYTKHLSWQDFASIPADFDVAEYLKETNPAQ